MKYILVLGLLFFAHYSISNNDLISNIDTLVISLNRKIAEMETSAYKAHNQADFMKRNADVATQKTTDLENIREISLIELLVNTLPEKVGISFVNKRSDGRLTNSSQNCREVGFVVIKNKKSIFAVERKAGDKTLSPFIVYFKKSNFYSYFLSSSFKNKGCGNPFRSYSPLYNIL